MRQNVHGNVPWYLDGLDPDTRDAAREAARRAGMSLDEWLHATISDRAARAFSESPPTVRRRAPAQPAHNYDDLDAVASRLSRVTRGRGGQAAAQAAAQPTGHGGAHAQHRGGYDAPSRGVDAIVAAVGAEAERKTRESASRTAEALDSVARWIERAEDRMSESTRVLSEGTRMALERQDRTANVLGEALALMTKRLDDIERKVVDGRNPSVGAAMEAMGKIESQLSRLGDLDDRRFAAGSDAENALRGFEQRIAGLAGRLGAGGGDRLDALRADVARIADQLETIRPARENVDAAASRLRKGVGDLASRVAGLATRDDIASLEQSLQELAREAAAAARTGREADLGRINGLVERAQAEIDRIAAEAASGAYREAGREYRSLSARVEEFASSDRRLATGLARELEAVRDALARLADPERLVDLQDEIRDLSQRVGHLARNQVTPVDFAGLRSAVEEIRGAMRKAPADGAGADLAAIERQYGSIAERLSGLTREQPREELARLSDAVSAMSARLDALAGSGGRRETEMLSRELAAMAAGLVDLRDGAKASDVEALRERVEDIGRRIEGLAERAPDIGRELAGLRRSIEDSVVEIRSAAPAEFAALGARLERLVKEKPAVDLEPVAGQIARLAQTLEEMRDAARPDIAPAVEAIAARLDRLAEQRPNVDLTPVAEQIARLSQKLEEMRDAARPDIGPAVEDLVARLAERGPGVDLTPVTEQIARLSEKLGDVRETPRSPELDALIARIDRLDENVRAIDVRGGVRSLEDMLAQLASKLDAADRPNAGVEAVDALENQIEAIARRLEREREASVDAVAKAARSAVAEGLGSRPLAESSARADLDDLTRSLAELKELHSLTQERGVEAVGGVQTTLDKVVQRLASLEARMQPVRAANPQKRRAPARAEPAAADKPASASPLAASPLAATSTAAPPKAGPAASFGPEMTPSRLLDMAKARAGLAAPSPASSLAEEADRPVATLGSLGGDIPLEPGSGRPRPASDAAGEDPAQIKASFIAAARRAAQNAAAEAAAATRRAPSLDARGARPASPQEKAPSAAAAGRRRPLLMAAAAVVLAIGAFQIGAAVIGGGERVDLAGEPRELADAVLADVAAPDVEAAPALPAPAPSLAAADAAPDAGDWPTATASIDAAFALPPEPSVIGMDDLMPLGPMPAIEGEPVHTGAAPALPPRRVPAFAATGDARLDPSPAPAPARATTLYPSMVSADELPAEAGPEELRRAVLAGDVAAVYELASRAADGRGMNRDPALAAKLFERAAAHGLVPAQFRIGNHYEKGIGVTRDFSLATLWYQRAAESGNARAMHNLAVLLAEGVSGRPDYTAALGWFRRAAEHGVRDSQYNLAVLLARGLGAEQNLEESYVWFAVAARQGDEDAAGKRDEVASRLDERALVMARARAEGWRPEIPRPEANEVAFPLQAPDAPQARQAGSPAFAG